MQSLEHELQSANKLHLTTKNKLEDELLSLRKKLRDTEAKYSSLASTPPKVCTILFIKKAKIITCFPKIIMSAQC